MKEKKKTNAVVIVGFVFSIISVFTFGFPSAIGLTLSIIGLAIAKKYTKPLKGLAIAGLIISIICFIGFWIFIIIALNSPSVPGDYTSSSSTKANLKDVKVIDFSQMSKDEIDSWCSENNLNCLYDTEYSDDIPVDGFMSQSTEAGTVVKEYTRITITYSIGHKKTPEEIAEEEKAAFKASCQVYSYDEISRNPDNYKGKPAVFRGKVAQVVESSYSSSIDLRVDVTEGSYGWWDDTNYVSYTLPEGSSRILEDDIITIYGTLDGLYSYTAVLGNTITLPKLDAKYIEY